MSQVNLDALIPREDFEVDGGQEAQNLGDKLKVNELLKSSGFFYSSLRKPDFQRETSDWDKEKITSFIKSFLDGDLIPSIILWKAGQYTFVIDGAHRLSALIAWVNDDYGDGFISQAFFNHEVDEDQKRAADQTRRHVNKNVGSYKELTDAIQSPEKAHPDLLQKAHRIGVFSLQLQWVTGSAEKAESSFFTINQKATPISETEISLLKARKKPYAMASRAILRAGSGHKYWKMFDPAIQESVETVSKEINESLFTPKIKTPIKTLDLPLAGKGYSSKSLSLIFDLVRLANDVEGKNVIEDSSGSETIKYLRETNRIIRRFTTTHPSSLGFHPAVYFYSEKGRYQPTAFMAWIEAIKDLERNNLLRAFTDDRRSFEKALIELKFVTSQVTVKYGSGLKGHRPLKEIYLKILGFVQAGQVVDEIKVELKKLYPYLNFEYQGDVPSGANFTEAVKSEIFITQALASASRCSICGGYVHVNSITFDHVTRKQDGGMGVAENGGVSHPYCNTTYKN